MLKRGSSSWGNKSWATKSMIEINDRLRPILNRPVDEISTWAQKLLDFQMNDKDVKRRYKTSCFTCQRYQEKF